MTLTVHSREDANARWAEMVNAHGITEEVSVHRGVAYRDGATAELVASQYDAAIAKNQRTFKRAADTAVEVRYHKDGSYRVENMQDVKALVTHLRDEGLSKSKAKGVAHTLLHGGRYLRQEYGTAEGSAPGYQNAGQSASRPNGLDDKRIQKREKLQWRERSLKPRSTFIARHDGPWQHYTVMLSLPRLSKLERDILHGRVDGATNAPREFGQWAEQRVPITH